MCILYNKRDATYTMFFIIISAVHVSGGLSAHHQESVFAALGIVRLLDDGRKDRPKHVQR
jgi:hypothetical protein